jgi:hypothetical protein
VRARIRRESAAVPGFHFSCKMADREVVMATDAYVSLIGQQLRERV